MKEPPLELQHRLARVVALRLGGRNDEGRQDRDPEERNAHRARLVDYCPPHGHCGGVGADLEARPASFVVSRL